MKTYLPPKFLVEREQSRCIQCQVVLTSAVSMHIIPMLQMMKCGAVRQTVLVAIVALSSALQMQSISEETSLTAEKIYNWRPEVIEDILKQAETGGVLLKLEKFVSDFAHHFSFDTKGILKHKYSTLFPLYLRPYGRLYAY